LKGFAHAFSPFDELSLARYWLPYFFGSFLVVPFFIAFEFVVELAKAIGANKQT